MTLGTMMIIILLSSSKVIRWMKKKKKYNTCDMGIGVDVLQ